MIWGNFCCNKKSLSGQVPLFCATPETTASSHLTVYLKMMSVRYVKETSTNTLQLSLSPPNSKPVKCIFGSTWKLVSHLEDVISEAALKIKGFRPTLLVTKRFMHIYIYAQI